ncbi:MAG: ATP-binding cassette domain-containing protein [Holosporales bacterium]|jgi:ATP-binding cassette subfamily F protein 3|nr:ATP-binding cassette domain-containing protein [Holosporales bacterium]
MAAALLQLKDVRKSFGARVLFNGVDFTINEGEHVGVIGNNGAGKTTLFDILIGRQEADEGTITRSRALHIAYLAQHDDFNADETVVAYVARLAQVEAWEVDVLAHKFGLSEEQLAMPVTRLSGGYQMRCKLLALALQRASLLLLDEPSNYLDLDTTLFLEHFLQEFTGAFLLISHDREFLRRTTDHILEIENAEATKFNGSLEDYFEQKRLLQTQLEARARSLQERREQILHFVARFGAKATKARQAQSRLKELRKMEVIDIKPLPVTARIRLLSPTSCGRTVVRLEKGVVGYSSSVPILKQAHVTIERGDRVAITGANGRGKTTLLKTLVGELPLLAGERTIGHNVQFSYFAQHVTERLQTHHTVLEALYQAKDPSVTEQDARDLAGALLFTKDDTAKTIRLLSGGERARVALGCVLLEKSNCLALDEPTNHLDFATTEALSQALQSYRGTIIFVSHDRSFVRNVATKIFALEGDQTVLPYPGTYDDYVWGMQQRLKETLG